MQSEDNPGVAIQDGNEGQYVHDQGVIPVIHHPLGLVAVAPIVHTLVEWDRCVRLLQDIKDDSLKIYSVSHKITLTHKRYAPLCRFITHLRPSSKHRTSRADQAGLLTRCYFMRFLGNFLAHSPLFKQKVYIV